jgi:hypothetical protein
MATYGEALAAIDDFRAELVHDRWGAAIPETHAMAFRAETGSPLAEVHATGVGVRAGVDDPKEGDFVIKVYVFDTGARAQVAHPLLSREYQGVEVDTEVLPVQRALPRTRRAPTKTAPSATVPADHRKPYNPVPGGVEIGPLAGSFVGTLGCYVRRGSNDDGPLFVLSNNHVLADVNRFPVGKQFTEPFSANPARVLAALSDFEPILFPGPNSQPRNVIDAAIAGVTGPLNAVTGQILGIKKYTPQLLAPRPGMKVTKAGRTTGVTKGTIRAIRVRGVQVNYGTLQNPVIATFDNAITVTGAGGAAFSGPGDSGSVILDQDSGRPVALLFAGDGVTTTACDVTAACARFNVRPV